MDWFKLALKKYAVVDGRARRAEYWHFVLWYVIIYVGLAVVDLVLGMGVLTSLFGLAMLIPSITVGVRRLHDTSRSGWWMLLGLIPVIGLIVLIIFFVQDGTPGENPYGANPKELATA